jgi:hypothetical protein
VLTGLKSRLVPFIHNRNSTQHHQPRQKWLSDTTTPMVHQPHHSAQMRAISN